MRKLQSLFLLAAAVLLASCAGGGAQKPALEFSNYEKEADGVSPEGAPASMSLAFAVPQGENEAQVIEIEKELIAASRVAEEVGAPEGETLQQIADNYIERFKSGIAGGELEPMCVYDLQIVCKYQNEQVAVFHVTDGVYGNGGPQEYLRVVRLSDGRMMGRDEMARIDAAQRSILAGRFVAQEDVGQLVDAEVEDFWIAPDSGGCRMKLQTGSHFFVDVIVPQDEIAPFLTEEGKIIFGLAERGADEADDKKADEGGTPWFSQLLDTYREMYLSGAQARKIEHDIRGAVDNARKESLPVTGSPYGISCSKAVIADYNVQSFGINIIMELVPDTGTDFHLGGYKGIGYSTDYGPYGKFVQAQALGGEQVIFARTCHCDKGKMLVTLIVDYEDLQQWKALDGIRLVEKKK